MWNLIQNLDGRDVDEVVASVRTRFPWLSRDDILDGLRMLDKYGFLDDAASESAVPSRYLPNVRYFSGFPGTSTAEATKMQDKLLSSKILILGLGGGGVNVATLLAGVGVGNLTILDSDVVEESNLGRQLLYREMDIGKAKAEVAASRLRELNSLTKITSIVARIDSSQDVLEYISDNDVVICALDEPPFMAQRRVNKAIVDEHVPCVFGANQLTHGRVFTVVPGETGCFDCLNLYYSRNDPKFVNQFRGFQQSNYQPETVAYVPTMWIITAVMADEAVRLITDYIKPKTLGLQYEIVYPDYTSFAHKAWPRYDDCPTCGKGNYDEWPIFQEYPGYL
ncbi:MAG: ThiF family adenylyltransferase [Mobiluncus sp.]|nr:ThiF family adenylyltransferase [Mobiluncus porci]MCI6585113.1 ThiF family adenylyltransferase [Mobiluncus sp.]